MVCNLLQDDWVPWIWSICNYEESIRVSLTFSICASFQPTNCCCFSLRNEISTTMYIGRIQTENCISIPVVDQDWRGWIRINVTLQRWKGNDVLIFCILDRHFMQSTSPLRSLWAARWLLGAHERTKRIERCRVSRLFPRVARTARTLPSRLRNWDFFAQRVTSILEIERSGFEVQHPQFMDLIRNWWLNYIPLLDSRLHVVTWHPGQQLT